MKIQNIQNEIKQYELFLFPKEHNTPTNIKPIIQLAVDDDDVDMEDEDTQQKLTLTESDSDEVQDYNQYLNAQPTQKQNTKEDGDEEKEKDNEDEEKEEVEGEGDNEEEEEEKDEDNRECKYGTKCYKFKKNQCNKKHTKTKKKIEYCEQGNNCKNKNKC